MRRQRRAYPEPQVPASLTALCQRQLWKKQGGDICFMGHKLSLSMQPYLESSTSAEIQRPNGSQGAELGQAV